jgi:capsular polysaccharide biosynthesis protein
MLVDSGKPFVLLYPEEWDAIPYVQQTLQVYPSIEKQRIPAGVHIQVSHLLLPEVRPFTACLDGNVLQNIARKLRSRFDTPIMSYPDKIFVNRRKAKYRKLENEDEVATCLKSRGFTEIDFDDMTIAQQIASVQHAKYIVIMHGAGMANCMFAQPNTKILELMHEYTTPETYRFVYWILANRMQCTYYVQFCKTISSEDSELFRNITVNIDLLTENIDKIIS